MQKKFFIKRFIRYLAILFIPTCILFVLFIRTANESAEEKLNSQAENTLANVSKNLDYVVSSVVFQNEQLTNNSYMTLSLKKLLKWQVGEQLSYSDAICQRNIKAMLGSAIQAYPFIQSIYLYLDGYNRYFTSTLGVEVVDEEAQWWKRYEAMNADDQNVMELSTVSQNGIDSEILTIYQKMLLMDGVVIVNIDAAKYRNLLNEILPSEYETVLYLNDDMEMVFSWNDTEEIGYNCDLKGLCDPENNERWINVGNEKYLIHTNYNEKYQLHLVSLISMAAKREEMQQSENLFRAIFLVNVAVMLGLAYATTARTFRQLDYMIRVFGDAENGIYPTQPRMQLKDEYDVIMNKIIYLFLQTVKLNGELKDRQHDQEVTQLEALQLQINPHFLFNTLQTLQLEIRKPKGEANRAEQVLEDLSDILKYTLTDPMERIELYKEIEYLKKYVAIQRIRFGDRFIIYYEVDEELRNFQVFRLMLQPLVENSILHGIRNKEGRGYIKLQIFKRKERIHFRVVDNGVGMSKEELEQLRQSIRGVNIHHIGLANVNSRLELYYGEEAGIRIRSKMGMGCVMEFSIPQQI